MKEIYKTLKSVGEALNAMVDDLSMVENEKGRFLYKRKTIDIDTMKRAIDWFCNYKNKNIFWSEFLEKEKNIKNLEKIIKNS